jgi:hypothetical protein
LLRVKHLEKMNYGFVGKKPCVVSVCNACSTSHATRCERAAQETWKEMMQAQTGKRKYIQKQDGERQECIRKCGIC